MRQTILLAAALISTLLATGWATAQEKSPVVSVETSLGNFKVELDKAKAPITVKNFLQYVDDKFYDGTLIHRVTNNPPVIQGGGFLTGMKEKSGKESIKNESTNGLSNERGTIAMARTNDPDSAKAQFYVNTKDNKRLDGAAGRPGYAVFGKVIEGMEVVDKIAQVATTAKGGLRDVPQEEVVIKSIRRVEK